MGRSNLPDRFEVDGSDLVWRRGGKSAPTIRATVFQECGKPTSALTETVAFALGGRYAAAPKLRRLLDQAMTIADHWLPELDPEDDNPTLVEHVTLFQEIRDEMRALDEKGGS